ncbi:recombinase family protein [uncultured Treponema sp.]|uniref:recombinase family protein n=1 Tax=uncultured Treponema sp. TaxID=162155 RepID=UPI00338D4C54
MIYGYIRVSTDRQTVENQRFEILRFCKKNSLEVGAWIEETISGTLTPDKRELGRKRHPKCRISQTFLNRIFQVKALNFKVDILPDYYSLYNK